jgi:Leucine-rich repeat (LRR) protein
MTYIAIEIGFLKNLKILYARYAKFKDIEEDLYRLKSLTEFYASGNRFTNMDPVLGMENLEILDLSDNRIETIPSDIGKLKHLKKLILNDNNITNVPDSLNSLIELNTIHLYNNENLRGKALTNKSLEDCRYCTSFENNCSSLKCYDDDDDDN